MKISIFFFCAQKQSFFLVFFGHVIIQPSPPTHLVIKHHHLATPPTPLFDDVILEWSLSTLQQSALRNAQKFHPLLATLIPLKMTPCVQKGQLRLRQYLNRPGQRLESLNSSRNFDLLRTAFKSTMLANRFHLSTYAAYNFNLLKNIKWFCDVCNRNNVQGLRRLQNRGFKK